MTLCAFFDLTRKFHALSTQKWPTMAYRNAPIFTPSPHKNGQLGHTEMHTLSRHCHTKIANLGIPNCAHFHALSTQKLPTKAWMASSNKPQILRYIIWIWYWVLGGIFIHPKGLFI